MEGEDADVATGDLDPAAGGSDVGVGDESVTGEGGASMSKEAFREIMRDKPEPQKAESMGAIEAATLGVQAIAPGLSIGKILGDIGHELKEQAQHGAHEAAAALLNGSGFVMYPRAGRELEAQAKEQESLKEILEAPAVNPPTPAIERERDGREV
jgi:hypothetical protein